MRRETERCRCAKASMRTATDLEPVVADEAPDPPCLVVEHLHPRQMPLWVAARVVVPNDAVEDGADVWELRRHCEGALRLPILAHETRRRAARARTSRWKTLDEPRSKSLRVAESRWRPELPSSPCSSKRTLASVPAPEMSLVATVTTYIDTVR